MLNINKKQRGGFTMIELVFVIVILGILAGVAIPRLAVTRDNAVLVKGRSELSAIRSAIASQRLERMVAGQGSQYITVANMKAKANGQLFGDLLPNPIYAKEANGHWRQGTADNLFVYRTGSDANSDVVFTYNATSGTFDCVHTEKLCKDIAE